MSELDRDAHEDINALLRRGLASCLSGPYGGLAGIWDRPDHYDLQPLAGFTDALNKHSAAGCTLADAIDKLADDLSANPSRPVERDLIGLGLFAVTDHPVTGLMGVCLAVVADHVHLVNWLACEPAPVWEIQTFRKAAEGVAATQAAALRSLRDLLSGSGTEAAK